MGTGNHVIAGQAVSVPSAVIQPTGEPLSILVIYSMIQGTEFDNRMYLIALSSSARRTALK